MRITRKEISVTNVIFAFVMFVAFASCSDGKPSKEDKYKSIESEISKELGVFEDRNEVSESNEKLIKSAVDDALRNNDFVYAKKYCDLLCNINYQESERYLRKVKDSESAIIKDSLEGALKKNDFAKAKKLCSNLETVRYSEALEFGKRIRAAEATFLIMQNNEASSDSLIASIDTRPTKKPSIGRESESTPAYDWQSKRHNSLIDDYLDQAIANKNYYLAKKLLLEYVDELTFKTVTKKDKSGLESVINVVDGYSDSHKREAMKRYEEAQKH